MLVKIAAVVADYFFEVDLRSPELLGHEVDHTLLYLKWSEPHWLDSQWGSLQTVLNISTIAMHSFFNNGQLLRQHNVQAE